MTSTKVALVLTALLLVPTTGWAQWPNAFNDFDRDEWDNGFFNDLRSWGNNAWNGSNPGYYNNTNPGSGTASYGQPSRVNGQVRQDRRPWSGDWWPRGSCGLAFKNTGGGLSPFEKYDSIVYNFYGKIPGAAAWEADPSHRHNDGPSGGSNWAGHCNGLAAASILTPEPRQALRIPMNQGRVVKLTWPSASSCRFGLFRDGQFDYQYAGAREVQLTIDDMKGWLAEIYMNCETQQVGSGGSVLGSRYNGSNINYNDPSFQDIHPHNYHYLLDTFIRQRQQSFVTEVDPHAPVNNHPTYAFECDMRPTNQGYTYCKTKVYYTDYAGRSNFVGTNSMTRTYEYALVMDSSGRLTRGQWINSSVSKHPDFVWIPMADKAASSVYENPCLNAGFVSWLFQKYGAYGGATYVR